MKPIAMIAPLVVLLFSAAEMQAQAMVNRADDLLKIVHVTNDFPVSDLTNKSWGRAKEVLVNKYWSGEAAPAGRHFSARLLWSNTALYIRFETNQTEPLIISEKPNLHSKTMKLWNRDVCEIFIAPDRKESNRYFEFEIAPNGEWIDLEILVLPDKRETDWDFRSGMESTAKIERDKVTMAIKVDWKALGRVPKSGDIWLGNLFRCVGKDPNRGYLAWQPTFTKEPAFHVPEKFGEFEFEK